MSIWTKIVVGLTKTSDAIDTVYNNKYTKKSMMVASVFKVIYNVYKRKEFSDTEIILLWTSVITSIRKEPTSFMNKYIRSERSKCVKYCSEGLGNLNLKLWNKRQEKLKKKREKKNANIL